MKTIYLIFISILIMNTACSNEERDIQGEVIFGSWELIEIFIPFGSSNSGWQQPNTSYYYNFYDNNTFNSNRFVECDFGTYTFTENTIELNYGCEGFTTGIEYPPGVFIENYIFENNYLILAPTYMSCDEGCGWKFKRISN